MAGGSALGAMARRPQSPAPERAITIIAVRVARADTKDMEKLRFRLCCRTGLAARCFRQISLLLQRMTKAASRERLKCSVTNSFWPVRQASISCGRNLFGPERVLEHRRRLSRPGC